MWTHYKNGSRYYCGFQLPDGLKKNQKLASNLLTPTTKDETHDELTSEDEIISTGRMTVEDWNICKNYAYTLFEYGQREAMEKGLILVDTKYEFGKDRDGNILLVDEIQVGDGIAFVS
jgi:phosphoribosylaminoimidazole-succinocarboxamide synthase